MTLTAQQPQEYVGLHQRDLRPKQKSKDTKRAKPTAVIYLRVSTKDQAKRGGLEEGFSIPEQRADCQARAQSMGVTILREFTEKGESAKTANRHELQKMLLFIAEHKPTYLIVHKIDRFARNTDDAVLLNIQLRAAGTQLVSVTENIDNSPSGKLLQAVMNGVAQYHVDNLAQEVMKGLRQKVAHGGTPFLAPIGYLNVPTMIEGREVRTIAVDEERAPHIQWLFEQYATGEWSLKALAKAATARGMTTRPTPTRPAGKILPKAVQHILMNRYYIGIVGYMGVEYDGVHQPLVSPELFQQVQDVLDARRVSSERSHRHSHYLTGTVRCGRCGARLVYNIINNGKGQQYDYFTCLTRLNERTCSLPYLAADEVEDAVADCWLADAMSPEHLDAVSAYLTEHLSTLAKQSEKEVVLLNRRIASVKAERVKWAESAMNETVPADIARDKQTELAAQLLELGRSRDRSASLASGRADDCQRVLAFVRDGAGDYATADPATRRAYNQFLYRSVLIDSDDEQQIDTGTTKTEVFAALDQLAEQVVAEVGSAVDGGSGDASAASLGGETVARDQMDHRSRRSRTARTRDHLDHYARAVKHERAGQSLRIVDSNQPAVDLADPCSNKGRLGWLTGLEPATPWTTTRCSTS